MPVRRAAEVTAIHSQRVGDKHRSRGKLVELALNGLSKASEPRPGQLLRAQDMAYRKVCPTCAGLRHTSEHPDGMDRAGVGGRVAREPNGVRKRATRTLFAKDQRPANPPASLRRGVPQSIPKG